MVYTKGSIAAKLSAEEVAAVAKKTLETGTYIHSGCGQAISKCTCTATDTILGTVVDNAVMWPLSLNEASKVDTSLLYIQGMRYWLRSPGSQAGKVCTVDGRTAGKYTIAASAHSYVHYSGSVMSWNVRPAFTMSMDKVLFVSAAEGGKAATAVSAVADYTGNEWKATVLDAARADFAATATAAGKVYTINYTGAKTGTNEYLSVLVKNAAGDITHYGKVQQLTAAAGTVTVDLSGLTLADTDKIFVINEQVNGDKLTDLSSALVAVSAGATDPEPTDPEPTDPEPTDPKPSDPVNPPTGDNNQMVLWIVLMAVSAVAVAGAGFFATKKSW